MINLGKSDSMCMLFTKTFKKAMLTMCMAFFGCAMTQAQVAIKNNLLYDAATTPNLGVEIGLTKKTTAQVVYGLNPWKFSDTKQMRHWLIMPEYRWWTCSRFNGHFFGIHAMGGEFNVQGIKDPLKMIHDIDRSRYEGWFVGGGVTYGYQWILSKHWNFEAALGFGYDYIQFKKYDCGVCGTFTKHDHTDYIGVTKLALSLEYLF